MPEKLRIDFRRDMPPEVANVAEPILAQMAELERNWTSTGSEDAYEQWLVVATFLHKLAQTHGIASSESL